MILHAEDRCSMVGLSLRQMAHHWMQHKAACLGSASDRDVVLPALQVSRLMTASQQQSRGASGKAWHAVIS